MSTPLTEQERHRLWEAGDHHPEQCDCAGDDWSAEGEWCGGLEDTFAAVEAIAAAREAAERVRLLGKLEALHKPFKICDDCDHDHTDKDVREGRAFDTGYSYTCEAAALYVACRACCTDDPDDPEQTEECASYHKHTLNPDDRCPTAALVADERGGTP